MQSTTVGILLLLAHSSLEESGDSSFEDEETEGESKIDFDCFSSLSIENSTLTCYLISPHGNKAGYSFKVCYNNEKECKTMKKNQDEYVLDDIPALRELTVCMITFCKMYSAKTIVRPGPPFNLLIIHNKPGQEYTISFKKPYKDKDYLAEKLIYRIVLRKEDDEWPDCENSSTANKQCINTKHNEENIPETNLEPLKKYEAKVRAKPDGIYFSGSWSSWSEPVQFKTNHDSGGINIPLVILAVVGFLLSVTMIVLITAFWERSIKPLVWPEIPNHKSALEKLCKKPNEGVPMSFNPSLFEDIPINKVDYIKPNDPGEEFFSPPLVDKDFPPSDKRQQLLEKNIGFGNTSTLQALDNGGFSSLEGLNVQIINPSGQLTAISRDLVSANPMSTSDAVSPPCGTCLVNDNPPRATASLLACSRMEDSLIYSNAVKMINDGLNACREEAYISMSAFKTPGSAIK